MGRFIALFVFAFSCVFLLSMSGVYHLLSKDGVGHLVLQRLDHAAIFVLIAGTFTAVHSVLFSGMWRWAMLVFVWAASATGITLKTVFFNNTPELLGLTLYLVFGWLGLISAVALWRRYGFSFIKPLLYGGLAYSVGAALQFFRQPVLVPGIVGAHELFHVAVLFGISFHWWFISSSFECESTVSAREGPSGKPAAPLNRAEQLQRYDAL